MKKSKVETAETRKTIVETASNLFRRDGIHATGLADVMGAAGLTHGGFYRHFNSKDELVAEAFGAGFASLLGIVHSVALAGSGEHGVKAIVENYLTKKHRDDAADGCPFAGMGIELARADDRTRAAVSEGFVKLVDAIAREMPRKGSEIAKLDAIFVTSAMIGALTMSRVVNDAKLSTSILRAVRDNLADI